MNRPELQVMIRVKQTLFCTCHNSTIVNSTEFKERMHSSASRADWENRQAHPVLYEESVFIFVLAWVYVFTSSDVCYLLPYTLFLFPSACSFFIVLTPTLFSPVFSCFYL